MQGCHRVAIRAFCTGLLVWSGVAQAQENPLDLPSQTYVRNAGPLVLAAGDAGMLVKKQDASVAMLAPQAAYEPPLWTGSNAHMTLGLATIAFAGLTALAAPDSCEQNCPNPAPPRETDGTHAKLAKATIALAAATVATGLIVHWKDFYLEDGIADPDNLHVLLAVSGAALMAYAANKSMHSTTPVSHAGIAELGAASMLVAVKLTW